MNPGATPLDRRIVITGLGVAQILAWGTSFYFPAVFAGAITRDTGWSLGPVVAGTSIGLLVAGLIAPRVGRLIAAHGGRPVLLASSLLFGAGLACAGLSPNMPSYLIAWGIIGLGMGTGLYDAVFSALGRLYGSEARGPITSLTLFGGFASTLCWPLSALMIDHLGWRGACFVYAALHIGVCLPLQVWVMGRAGQASSATMQDAARGPAGSIPRETPIFAVLMLILSISAGIGATVIVNMMILLQARGLDYAAAVALGALFGPAQVGARVVERLFGKAYHPIWTMIGSCTLMAIGLVMLSASLPVLALIILLYGAGYGISWIGRGTLPLALFGPERFPVLMGKLAFPSLIVQALAPSLGALVIERAGADATIGGLTVLALVNVALIAVLWRLCRAARAVL